MQAQDNNNNGVPSSEQKVLQLTVNNVQYKWYEEYISGKQIRELTGLPETSLESLLFLSIPRPWEDELINNDTVVNLARPEIEHFYSKNVLLLTINGKEYTWDKEYITGIEIKQLAEIAPSDELFLSIKKPWDDELIGNDTRVNLARPGIESFYSKKVEYKFFVDKQEYKTSSEKLTVRQILVDFAKKAEATNTLAEKQQGTFHEYKDLNELIVLSQVRHFVTFSNEPTTVS